MAQSYRIELLTLGNELLLGLRANTHLDWLGGELAAAGLTLARNTVIGDDPEEIASCFREAWRSGEIIITTGGLGPTTDDLTRETLARILGVSLVHHPPTEAALRERFAAMGREPTPNNLKQTYLLEGAEAIPNPNGTAPGQWLQRDGRTLIMLPGPPFELQPMWRDAVLPRLRRAGYITEQCGSLQIRTSGVGESRVETELQPVFDGYPGRLQVAYCAHQGVVDVRLTSVGHSLSQEEITAIGEVCRERLGSGFVGFGDPSLAQLVLRGLRERERTLALAESCTGGMLASAFTDICGASKVFAGGVVCYNNDAKIQILDVPECLLQQHGAVSAETAVAMATAAAERFDTDYALSTTGYAGPSGGSDAYPVGTVFLGLHAPGGAWGRRLHYRGNRGAVQQRTVHAALDWLWRFLNEEDAADV